MRTAQSFFLASARISNVTKTQDSNLYGYLWIMRESSIVSMKEEDES